MKYIILFLLFLFVSCSRVRVKTHDHFMGPSTWEATDGKISVYAYNGDCWGAKEKLKMLAKEANDGKFDWSMMSNDEFKKKKLEEICR